MFLSFIICTFIIWKKELEECGDAKESKSNAPLVNSVIRSLSDSSLFLNGQCAMGRREYKTKQKNQVTRDHQMEDPIFSCPFPTFFQLLYTNKRYYSYLLYKYLSITNCLNLMVDPARGCAREPVSSLLDPMKSNASGRKTMSAPRPAAFSINPVAWRMFPCNTERAWQSNFTYLVIL